MINTYMYCSLCIHICIDHYVFIYLYLYLYIYWRYMIYDLYDSYMFYLSVCLSYRKSIIFNMSRKSET